MTDKTFGILLLITTIIYVYKIVFGYVKLFKKSERRK